MLVSLPQLDEYHNADSDHSRVFSSYCANFRRTIANLIALIGIILMAAPPSLASERTDFIAQHRCSVVSALDEIHRRGPVGTSHNRFLILKIHEQFQRYVQCIFFDRDRSMYCEAASGAYDMKIEAPYRYVPTSETIEALHRLGYRQEAPTENYSRTVALGSPPDVGIAADLMLGALYDAFDARAGTIIDMDAPNGGAPFQPCGAPGV